MDLFYRKCKSRKGNVMLEGLTVLVVMAIFAIAGLYGHQVFSELNDDIQEDETMSNTAKNTVGNLQGHFPAWYDNVFLFAFVLFIMFVLASVFLLDTHPIFFAISIILLIGVFVVAIFVGNAYHEIASDETVAPYANDMPYMSWVLRHIAEMIIAIGFISGVALFVKVKML